MPAVPLSPAIVVAAADHGVVEEGVSPYPQEVTGQMLANFVGGGAAVAVLAREAGARLVVVDAGVIEPPDVDGVRSEVVDGVRGTGNIARGPAMPVPVAPGLIERGVVLADELADDGIGILAVGDMGIGNTTAASTLCAALLPADPDNTCGPGTGFDDAGVDAQGGGRPEGARPRTASDGEHGSDPRRSPRSAGSRSRSSPA